MLNPGGYVIQWGWNESWWRKVEKGIKQIGDSVRVASQLAQGSRFGVKLSIPVENKAS